MGLQTERERGREGEREKARSPRKRFPLWGNKGRAIRTSSFHPSSRRNRKIAGHRTLLHFIIFALFHIHIRKHAYTYIHTHPRGRCERSVFTKDWLTYVYVCVCMRVSIPPSPLEAPHSRWATIKKVKKQLLLSRLHTISNNLNDHK